MANGKQEVCANRKSKSGQKKTWKRCLEDSPCYLGAIHYYYYYLLLLLIMSIWKYPAGVRVTSWTSYYISDKNQQHIPKWTNETR